MDKKEMTIGNPVNSIELRSRLPDFRDRYDNLILVLGSVGTEVERTRIIESDPGMYPYRFVREAVHRFVFPPQEVEIIEDVAWGDDESYILLDKEAIKAIYDKSRVEGELEVKYDDSGTVGVFRVEDLHPTKQSQLPAEANVAIERAFEA